MDMDLRTWTDSRQKMLLNFTEKLAESEGLIDFNNPDLEQAEAQAKEFIQRREAGYQNSEIKADAEIRTGVRAFLRRRGYKKDETETDNRKTSTTKPNYW